MNLDDTWAIGVDLGGTKVEVDLPALAVKEAVWKPWQVVGPLRRLLTKPSLSIPLLAPCL